MTRDDHASGSDRIAEVVTTLEWQDDEVVVNLQGDEPCVVPQLLESVGSALIRDTTLGISTLATPIETTEDLFDSNIVKVVLGDDGRAMYFSRAPIPWVRNVFTDEFLAGGVSNNPLPSGIPFLRHIGVYAYRVVVLKRMCMSKSTAYEDSEMLEQLRALAMGIPIYVSIVQEAPAPGIDVKEDLERLKSLLTNDTSKNQPVGAIG